MHQPGGQPLRVSRASRSRELLDQPHRRAPSGPRSAAQSHTYQGRVFCRQARNIPQPFLLVKGLGRPGGQRLCAQVPLWLRSALGRRRRRLSAPPDGGSWRDFEPHHRARVRERLQMGDLKVPALPAVRLPTHGQSAMGCVARARLRARRIARPPRQTWLWRQPVPARAYAAGNIPRKHDKRRPLSTQPNSPTTAGPIKLDAGEPRGRRPQPTAHCAGTHERQKRHREQ